MKVHEHLIVAIICYSIILYHSIISFNIMDHPYMVGLVLTCFGIGGYHSGLAIGKVINK